MQRFNTLKALYSQISGIEPDSQILILLEDGIESVPLIVILKQYKYCKEHGILDKRYFMLRDALMSMISESDMESLEVSYGTIE